MSWYHLTTKDLQAPFTYYWVSGSDKIWTIKVVSARQEGNRWLTKVEPGGLDFSLAEHDGVIVIPFTGFGNTDVGGSCDPIFNNYWAAFAYSLKQKAKDAA